MQKMMSMVSNGTNPAMAKYLKTYMLELGERDQDGNIGKDVRLKFHMFDIETYKLDADAQARVDDKREATRTISFNSQKFYGGQVSVSQGLEKYFEYSEIAKVAIVLHEFMHLTFPNSPEGRDHFNIATMETYFNDFKSAIREYTTANKIQISEHEITALFWLGLLDKDDYAPEGYKGEAVLMDILKNVLYKSDPTLKEHEEWYRINQLESIDESYFQPVTY